MAKHPSCTICLGRDTLVEVLGEGWLGAVWLAEQTVPVRRQVALKILKAGMDTREVIPRSEHFLCHAAVRAEESRGGGADDAGARAGALTLMFLREREAFSSLGLKIMKI